MDIHVQPASRRGNAMVLAIGVMAVVAGLVILSASQATDNLSRTTRRSYQQEATAACMTVLDRYESRVITIGNDDPAGLAFKDNFGVDFIGSVEVKWKIEPVRSLETADDQVTRIPFIQNPRPANTAGSVDPIDPENPDHPEQPNDGKWLFRVAAEAVIREDSAGADEPATARVQGARYVSVNKAPLFKHVIFYAQNGPKGDLELAHSGKAWIDGDVHSNGAIYLGAAAKPLDKDATLGPAQPTVIGRFQKSWSDANSNGIPDTQTVDTAAGSPVLDGLQAARVVGVQGVFRLSKPLMFAAVNGFPMTGTGISGRTWLPAEIYDLGATLRPGEKSVAGSELKWAPDTRTIQTFSLGSVSGATGDGRFILPFRIKDLAGPIADAGDANDLTRLINGVPLRGIGSYWNDARNQTTTDDAYQWKVDGLRKYAPDSTTFLPRGFNGSVRSQQNGGSVLRLPSLFDSGKAPPAGDVDTLTAAPVPARPFEAQALAYFDTDGDPTTDNHEHARPIFLDATGAKTTTFPSSTDANVRVREAPGTYLSYALGSGTYAMERLVDGTGWAVVSTTGGSQVDNKPTGLVIRERPFPATAIWPGTSATVEQIVPAGTPRWLPFAYGKQFYPSTFPFRVADVSDNLIRYLSDPWIDINPAPTKNKVSYALGGTLAVTAANWEGNNRYDGGTRYRFDNFNTARLASGQPNAASASNDRRTYSNPRTGNVATKIRTGNRIRTHNDQNHPYDATPGTGRILYGGFDPLQNDDANGAYRPYSGTVAATNNVPGNSEGYGRLPYFYRDNWKFVHLQGMPARPAAEVGATTGLTRTVIMDTDASQWGTNLTDVSEFTLTATGVRAISTDTFSDVGSVFNCSNMNTAARQGLATALTYSYSVRWEGYLVPPVTGAYTFYAGPTGAYGGSLTTAIDDGFQAWILDRNVTNPTSRDDAFRPLFPSLQTTSAAGVVTEYRERTTWTPVDAAAITADVATTGGNANTRARSAAVTLTAGVAYPIVIDYYQVSNSASAALSWSGPGIATPTPMPASVFRTRPTAAAGFDLPTFQAVQAEVDLSSLKSNPAAQKVGLMLRGSPGMGPLLNGADPYLAILYNPQRGVFAQTRLQRASHVQDVITKYFISAGSGPSGGANSAGEVYDNSTTLAAGMNRTATVAQLAAPAAATVNQGYNTGATYAPASATWTSTPALYSGAMSKTLGDGTTYTILDNFYVGTYTGTATATTTKSWWKRLKQTLHVRMTDTALPPFISTDSGNTISFFTNATTSSVLSASTLAQAAAAGDNWTVITTALAPATVPAESANVRFTLGRNFYGSTITGATYSITGSPVTTSVPASGGATTIWTALTAAPSAGSLPRVNWNGTIRTATAADLQTITGIAFSTNSSSVSTVWNAVKTAAFNNVKTKANADPSTGYPLDAVCADPGTPVSAPSIPDFATPRTFSYPRVSSAIFDVNAYTTTGGTWLAGSKQYLPHPTTTNNWAALVSADTWPLTGGFRPDQWGLGTASAPASMSVTNTPLIKTQGNPNGGGGTTDWDNYDGSSDPTMLPYVEQGYDDLTAVPAMLAADSRNRLWLRMEWTQANAAATTGTATLKYYVGQSTPASGAAFTTVKSCPLTIGNLVRTAGVPAGSLPQVLAGPCVQSGDYDNAARAVFKGLRVETASGVIDASTWDQGATPKIARYLASQYQVFWGGRDITEEFFNYDAATGGAVAATTTAGNLCASEEWFFQPREFWSQRRTWEFRDGSGGLVEKDPFAGTGSTFTSTLNRELLAKTTVLRLNAAAIQGFLAGRTLVQAMAKPFTSTAVDLAGVSTDTLVAHFNGVFFAARTNRYPWNPLKTEKTTAVGINPWSPHANLPLPNSTGTPVSHDLTIERIANGQPLSAAATLAGATYAAEPNMLMDEGGYTAIHRLQPYVIGTDLGQAPALMPEDFHHGVMIANAADLNWGYPASGTPAFGTSKTIFVSPNALYLHGDLNTVKHVVDDQGTTREKVTPVAAMGDAITMLSGAWSPASMQGEGLWVGQDGSISGGGILADVNLSHGPTASTTTYNTGLVTCNLPSSRLRVMEDQSAPFIDAMLLLENWSTAGAVFNLYGSLVVLDSRRYSRAFLLDAAKTHGTTPFGFTLAATADSAWLGIFAAAGQPFAARNLPAGLNANGADWVGASPQVYGTPAQRNFTFNDDLLTAAGTPPFTPFGITAAGVGSWLRVIE